MCGPHEISGEHLLAGDLGCGQTDARRSEDVDYTYNTNSQNNCGVFSLMSMPLCQDRFIKASHVMQVPLLTNPTTTNIIQSCVQSTFKVTLITP